MLTTDELIKELSATIGKTKVDKLTVILKEHHFALKDLINLTFHPHKVIAYRAAWLLENLFLQRPESYVNDLGILASRVKEVKNPSCKRHYAKIMMHLTDTKAPAAIRGKIKELDMQPIVEQLFDWIIDPKVLIAVKIFAAQALFNLRERYGWINSELAEQIRFIMRNGTPAIQSRGKKLLGELSSE